MDAVRDVRDKYEVWRKNGRFSLIPARTKSVVIVGHFFVGPDSPAKFRWWLSKIKGTYTSEVGMARYGQKPVWAPKMTHSLEMEIFSGWYEWENCSPGCPVDKKHDSKTKNWLLAPNI